MITRLFIWYHTNGTITGSIAYLECYHSLCCKFLKKLKNHVRPFCRHVINPPVWFRLVIITPQKSTEDRILEISENTVISRRKKRRKSKKSSIKSFFDKKEPLKVTVEERELQCVK